MTINKSSFFPSYMRQWTHPGIIISSEVTEKVIKKMLEMDPLEALAEIEKLNPTLAAQILDNPKKMAITAWETIYKLRVKKYVFMSEKDLPPPILDEQLLYNKALQIADRVLKKGIKNHTVAEVEQVFKEMHGVLISPSSKVTVRGSYRNTYTTVRRVPYMDVFDDFQKHLKQNDPTSLPCQLECKPYLDKGGDYYQILFHGRISSETEKFIRKYLYIAPEVKKISSLMQALIGDVQKNLKEGDAIKLAAQAFMQFVNIHPFEDANGRIGRIFMNMILIEGGHQAIAFSHDSDYSKAVEEDQVKGNGAFERFIRPIVAQFEHEAKDPKDIILKWVAV